MLKASLLTVLILIAVQLEHTHRTANIPGNFAIQSTG
jgi:hypothetical protein